MSLFVVGLALSAVVFSSGVDLNSDMFSSALSQAPGVNTEALNQVLTYLLKIICGFYILGMPY